MNSSGTRGPTPPSEQALSTWKSRLERFLSAGRIGVAFALAAGIVGTVYRILGSPLRPEFPEIGWEYLAVLPTGLLLFSSPVLLAVALLHALRPRWVSLRRTIAVLAFLPFLSLSFLVLRSMVVDWSHLVLALGLAAGVGRLSPARAASVRRVAAWGAPILVLIPLTALLLETGGRAMAERKAIGQLSPASPTARNVLLIVWDTVRGDELSLYGYPRNTTPFLVARASGGTVFDRAYSTAPWTVTSHASIFTGQWAQQVNTDWQTGLNRDHPVITTELARAGYRVAGFTANLQATSRASGLARGFHHYEDWNPLPTTHNLLGQTTIARYLRRMPLFNRLRPYGSRIKDAAHVTDDFLRWLDSGIGHDRGVPFFGYLNYFNAHGPYRAPKAYRERFPGGSDRDAYDAAIGYQDAELDRLLEVLARRGVLDRTLVILTSDHGEAFGDHGYQAHGESLFREQLHVPLILWLPNGVPPHLRVQAPVSLRDLAPTILDLALGRGTDPFPGRSLARFWNDTTRAGSDTVIAGVRKGMRSPDWVQIARGNTSSLILGRRHYIVDGTGTERLFDMVADPLELHDLAGHDSVGTFLANARRILRSGVSHEWFDPIPEPGTLAP